MTAVEIATPLGVTERGIAVPGQTIAELYADRPALALRPVVAVLNGFPVLRRDDGWRVAMIEGDRLEFVILPGEGGNAKSIIRSVALIALSVASIVVAPYLTAALGIAAAGTIGASVANGLISAALIVGGTLAINALLPLSQSLNISPTYNLNPQGNAARLLAPIPRVYGRTIFVPDYASLPFSDFEGNDQYLYQLFCLGVGYYDVEQVLIGDTGLWTEADGYLGNFQDVQIEIIDPGDAVTLFPVDVVTSSDVATNDLSNTTNDIVGPFVVNPSGTLINQIAVDIVFPKGLYRANDDGSLGSFEIVLKIEVRAVDDAGFGSGPYSLLSDDGYDFATATAQRVTRLFSVTPGRYEVQITRTTDYETSTRYANDCTWIGLRGYVQGSNVFPDVTLLAVKMLATSQLNGLSSRQFKTIQTGKVQIWDGTTWSAPTATRSIVWAACDMLRNSVYGVSWPDAGIDLAKCLELDATFTTRGDTFDGVLDTATPFWTALGTVLSVGRTKPLLIAGVVTFVRDEPRSLARGVFTPRNIRQGSFVATHMLTTPETPDDVVVTYMDETTWQQVDVTCSLPDSLSLNPARITLLGIVNRDQAFREGMYQAAVNKYRRIFAQLNTEMEGKLLLQGDSVLVSHDLAAWSASGDILDYVGGEFVLSELMVWPEETTFYLRLSDRTNKEWGPFQVTRGSGDDRAIPDPASTAAVVTATGQDLPDVLSLDDQAEPTKFIFGTAADDGRHFLVVQSSPSAIDNVQLALVIDDPRVYTADGGTAPPLVSGTGPGIDPLAPVLTSFNVVQDPLSGSDPVTLDLSVGPVAGAISYVYQFSYDDVSWTGLSGTSSTIVAQLSAGTIYFRAAAIGVAQGPWITASGSYGTPTALPGPPSALSASASVAGGTISASWVPGPRATSYTLQVVVSSVVELTQSVTAPFGFFDATDITGAGGFWTDFTVQVRADNAAGSSAFITQDFTGIDPTPPNTITLTGDVTGSGVTSIATTLAHGDAANLDSGTLPAARLPALTGDVTTTAGAVATTIAANAVTNAKAAQMGALTIKGNNTGSTANPGDVSVGAWTTFTSAVASSSGTLTTASGSGRYQQIGKMVHVYIDISITTNGSGAGSILAGLPVTSLNAGGQHYHLAGREIAVSGKALIADCAAASGVLAQITNYDGTYPGADGAHLIISGVYEAA